MIKNKPYKDGVTLKQILEDGWSSGFQPEQTIMEAGQMGYSISLKKVLIYWDLLTNEMEKDIGVLR